MQTQQAPPTPPAADAKPACPSCGKPVDRSQPFCLECGRRIAHEYRRPPSWRIPIALTALLVVAAGIAAGFGITELTEQDEGPETIIVKTTPDGRTVPADPGETPPTAAPTPPAARPPAATTPPPPPTTPPSGAQKQPTVWPPGEEAYTVVLLTTKDRAAADRIARRAAAGGGTAGVLESGDYKRFEPGLFVAFTGQYDTVDAASENARQLGGDYPGAYARFIEPK